MTKKEAKELAIKKWQFIINGNGKFDKKLFKIEHPEIYELEHACSYCYLYKWTSSKLIHQCKDCPIRFKGKKFNNNEVGCRQTDHPFYKWSTLQTKESAQDVLDFIIAN